jgi:hypothetical protein
MSKNKKRSTGKPHSKEWPALYGELLEQGPAFVDVSSAFKKIAAGLHKQFVKNPEAASEKVFALLAANTVELILRSTLALEYAKERADDAVTGKDSSMTPDVQILERLERQQHAFTTLMAAWGKTRHTMGLNGRGR